MTRIKMVVLVNTSLKMSAGKMAAQVGHATCPKVSIKNIFNRKIKLWQLQGSPKIVLNGQNDEYLKEIHQICKTKSLPARIIKDAGLTQVPAGSITCLGIGPDKADKIDEVTGHLKLLDKWPCK